ncbi:MAG: copper-translocating P-type ATPase [Treponema sp.]|nr:copper-translocating P-type ATPase [Treponema sp.]
MSSCCTVVKEKDLNKRLIVAGCFSAVLLYIAMAPMIPVILPFPEIISPNQAPLIYALIQLILTIPVVIAGGFFYTSGFKKLFQRKPVMDSLIAIGTCAAIIYSLYNTFQIITGNKMAAHSLYYETAAVIITLILLGKSLESSSKKRTGNSIKNLLSLVPKTAIIIADGKGKEVPVEKVVPGNIIYIKPGMKIPVDGVITEGYTSIDESMLTGESIPVDKKPGDLVFCGTLNCNGVIKVSAEKTGKQTALAQIIKLVEESLNSKAPIAKLADVVSSYFVPVVLLIAFLAGIAWFAAASSGLINLPENQSALEFSLTIFICILVISCPCALGLATPTAVIVATGKGAENGILIKSGQSLETAGKTQVIVFDKTGTITEGKPEVSDIIIGNSEWGVGNWKDSKEINENFLKIAAAAEKGSEHPLGQSIVREAEKQGLGQSLSEINIKDFKAIPGFGIEANAVLPIISSNNIVSVLIGNKRLMQKRNIVLGKLDDVSDRLALEGKTPIFVALYGKIAGIIALADVIKTNTKSAIEKIYRSGIDIVMVTGDNRKTSDAIAKEAGIKRVISEVLPQDKLTIIKNLQTGNKKVAMVGDGINDAPALAQADIGIAIGSGTDVAIEAADIILMRNDPMDVPAVINLSKKSLRIIKQNLFWAFGYNILGIPVAAGFLYLFGGPLLNPMFAAAAMSLSSLSVLLNTLRLKLIKN